MANRVELDYSELREIMHERDRLSDREFDARRIITAAFGEYACMIKAKLSEEEVAAFERNFAVDARKWLAEPVNS